MHLDEIGTELHVQVIDSQMCSERLETMLRGMNCQPGETSPESKAFVYEHVARCGAASRHAARLCVQHLRESLDHFECCSDVKNHDRTYGDAGYYQEWLAQGYMKDSLRKKRTHRFQTRSRMISIKWNVNLMTSK